MQRDKAWAVYPYPCIGQFRFLELNLAGRTDIYPELVFRLKTGGKFLDIGCCLGQDVRKLVADGVSPQSVFGAELNDGFVGLGFELFRDRATMGQQFMIADVLDATRGAKGAALEELEGKLDVVQLGMILHLFTRDEQITAFKRAITLLKPEKDGQACARGTMIIGQAGGNVAGIETPSWGKMTLKHNEETFQKLVDDISAQTGTRWDVKAELDYGLSTLDGKRTWDDPRTRRLLFTLTRI